ncbi:hypothetical protein D9M68_723580 [compost metagenome]
MIDEQARHGPGLDGLDIAIGRPGDLRARHIAANNGGSGAQVALQLRHRIIARRGAQIDVGGR